MIGSAFPQKIVRRAFCVLASFLLAGSVQAEWSQLGRTDTFRLYLDQKLIQKSGDFVQVWQLMDFTVAQWADARTAVGSIKNLIEYDCTQPRLRTLAAEAYTEQMGPAGWWRMSDCRTRYGRTLRPEVLPNRYGKSPVGRSRTPCASQGLISPSPFLQSAIEQNDCTITLDVQMLRTLPEVADG